MATDENIVTTKNCILNMMSELDDTDRDSIEHWISSQSYRKDLNKLKSLSKTDKQLSKLGAAIKNIIPFEAEFTTENIVMPLIGDQADCNKINTYHLDEFLYDNEEMEKLAEEGKIQRHYCVECHSRNINKLTFISHSMSRQALQYVFKVLLPGDLSGKQILDVGSRIGAVLYAGYYLSNASLIIGVEMNKECCAVQEQIISQFHFDNSRIKVVHSDIMERIDIVENSNVIFINVLDFFISVEKQRNMWYFFKRHIRKGSYIVTNRAIENTLNSLDIYEKFIDWLSICRPFQLENEILFNLDDFDNSDLHLYIVT